MYYISAVAALLMVTALSLGTELSTLSSGVTPVEPLTTEPNR